MKYIYAAIALAFVLVSGFAGVEYYESSQHLAQYKAATVAMDQANEAAEADQAALAKLQADYDASQKLIASTQSQLQQIEQTKQSVETQIIHAPAVPAKCPDVAPAITAALDGVQLDAGGAGQAHSGKGKGAAGVSGNGTNANATQ